MIAARFLHIQTWTARDFAPATADSSLLMPVSMPKSEGSVASSEDRRRLRLQQSLHANSMRAAAVFQNFSKDETSHVARSSPSSPHQRSTEEGGVVRSTKASRIYKQASDAKTVTRSTKRSTKPEAKPRMMENLSRATFQVLEDPFDDLPDVLPTPSTRAILRSHRTFDDEPAAGPAPAGPALVGPALAVAHENPCRDLEDACRDLKDACHELTTAMQSWQRLAEKNDRAQGAHASYRRALVMGISAIVVLGITQMSHEQRVLLSARLSKLYLRRG